MPSVPPVYPPQQQTKKCRTIIWLMSITGSLLWLGLWSTWGRSSNNYPEPTWTTSEDWTAIQNTACHSSLRFLVSLSYTALVGLFSNSARLAGVLGGPCSLMFFFLSAGDRLLVSSSYCDLLTVGKYLYIMLGVSVGTVLLRRNHCVCVGNHL